MNLTLISDTHERKLKLPEGEVLIHAGDISSMGTREEITEFLNWFAETPFDLKIFIAGNHDFGFERDSEWCLNEVSKYKAHGVVYLNDSGFTHKGVNFWGSPVTPEFNKWAFNRARNEAEANFKFIKTIKPHWDLIPDNTDVLITHGPPYKILDKTIYGQYTGCDLLRTKILEVKPKIHVFGHIHESRGVETIDGVRYYNASCVDENYRLRDTFYWKCIL